MHLDKYTVQILRDSTVFAFVSIGVNGNVLKVVRYEEMDESDTYNLAFGDFDVTTGELDDKSITNNRDREKVLATVAETVVRFLDFHPQAKVFAQGSTEVRTWLYQRKLNQYYDEVTENFFLSGQTADGWETFERSKDYQAFLIQLKS